MRRPQPAEEYITIVDNKGRERIQRVEYVVTDVRGETVYVTADGLAYARDSLVRKGQDHILEVFDRIPAVLAHPEKVPPPKIWHIAPGRKPRNYGLPSGL